MHIDFTLCLLQKPRAATVDEFIARMAPLLDMERDAEVAQVHLAFRVCLATSQVHCFPVQEAATMRKAPDLLTRPSPFIHRLSISRQYPPLPLPLLLS